MQIKLSLLLIVVAAGLLFVTLTVQTEHPPLPDLGPVGSFSLIDQDGRPVRRADLLGSVWVANFIFTRCAGPCPVMTSTLQMVKEKLPSGVRFVSFTVDPDHDNAALLHEYAGRYEADLKSWSFLTGDKQTVLDLAAGLKLSAAGSSPGDFVHSSRFVVVDRTGIVRGMPRVVDADLTVDEEELKAFIDLVHRTHVEN